MASSRARPLEIVFVLALKRVLSSSEVFKDSRSYRCRILMKILKVRFSLTLYNFDCPRTNRIALNLFTWDKSMKNVLGL